MVLLLPLLGLALNKAIPPRLAASSHAAAHTPAAEVPTELQLSKTILQPASLHPKREGASLSAFMARTPAGALMSGLQRHLPASIVSCERASAEDDSVWLLTLRCIHLGPRLLGLWLQPKLVLWLRKKAHTIEAEAHLCGLDGGAFVWGGGENARVRVSKLDIRSSLTWIEESIPHLQGDYAPVVLCKSRGALGLGVRATGGWARLLPAGVLSSLAAAAAGKALGELQQAAAAAVVEEYEAWREGSAGGGWGSVVDSVAADGDSGEAEAAASPTFHDRFAWN